MDATRTREAPRPKAGFLLYPPSAAGGRELFTGANVLGGGAVGAASRLSLAVLHAGLPPCGCVCVSSVRVSCVLEVCRVRCAVLTLVRVRIALVSDESVCIRGCVN